jgi:beta-glucosidase
MSEAWRDATHAPQQRARALLAQMTLDEKLAQLGCVWSTQLVEAGAFSKRRAQELMPHGTGHVTRLAGATSLRPAASAAFANGIQRFLASQTRLGIPAIVHEESCAGLLARDATQFPQAIGLASSWNPELVEAAARVIRAQMLATGARQTLAPVLDIARDPRWGRTEETYGEDPYLASRIGVAYVRGIQGDDLSRGVAATAKHFIAYGLGEGGMNHAPAQLGPRELRDVFARPFAAAIAEAGLASVMNAYNEVDGLPCAGSRAILDALLRGELGFQGVVVADYFSVRLLESFHRVAADAGEAARIALEAGLDAELPATDCYGPPLREAVARGRVPLEWVDRSALRMLELKFALGLFEQASVDEAAAPEVFDTPEQRDLALELARQSLVLLRNEGPLLPLDPSIGTLAVIGPGADDARLLLGDYHYPAHLEMMYASESVAGSSSVLPRPDEAGEFRPGPHFVPITTVLAGIRALVSPRTRILAERGCGVAGDAPDGIAAAVLAARRADAAVLVVAGRSGLTRECTSGEFRDAADMGRTGSQQRLVEEVVATGTPTVVVLVGGRPLAIPWIAEQVPAVLAAWLPGEEGGRAIAEVLFGMSNPGGRLPVSLPRSVGQVPVYYRHKVGGGRSQPYGDYTDLRQGPLFPFGHGLCYTRFEYADLAIAPSRPRAGETVAIELVVANRGERSGDEVVQLYLRDVLASVTRPVLQLAGFARVRIAAGESRRVRFQLDPAQLAFHDAKMHLVVEPGEVRVFVGASSQDLRCEGCFSIRGRRRRLAMGEIAPTRVELI